MIKKIIILNNGFIDYEEFLRVTLDIKSFVNENALILAFVFFDKNRSGYINRDKIMSYLINSLCYKCLLIKRCPL